jgi:molybdopterin synthase catalytic subunit
MTAVSIKLSSETLSVKECLKLVEHPSAGGIDLFVGTVRNQTKGKSVSKLYFEAYPGMAKKEMEKIANQAIQKWDLFAVAIHHRTGDLEIGEIPVIIAASSAHRDAAFQASRYMIDTLKESVPIWKKEFLENGEVWVAAHP